MQKGSPERRVLLEGLLKVGMEHSSEEARKKYLKEHPGADPKNHTVSDGGGKDKGGGGMDDPTSLSDDDLKQVFDAGLHEKDEWDDLIAPSLKVLEKAISEGGVSGDDIEVALDMMTSAKATGPFMGKGSKKKKELASKLNAKIDALMKAGEEAKSGKKEAPKKEVKKGPAKDPGLENQDNTMSMLKDLGYDLGKNPLGYSVDFTKPGALGKVIERSGIGDDPAGVKKVLDNPNLSDQDRKYVESFAKSKARKMEQAFNSEAKKKLKDIPDRYGTTDGLVDEAKDPDFEPDEYMDDEYKEALKAVAKDWASTSKKMKPWQDLKKSRGKKGSDRKALIRLASSLEKGSPERKAVLKTVLAYGDRPYLVPLWDVQRSLGAILRRLKVPQSHWNGIFNKMWAGTNSDPESLQPNRDGFEQEILPLINAGRAADGHKPAQARSWKSAETKWWNVLTKAQYKHHTKWIEEQRRNRFPDPYDPHGSGFWD
jgi:hypothetical protein